MLLSELPFYTRDKQIYVGVHVGAGGFGSDGFFGENCDFHYVIAALLRKVEPCRRFRAEILVKPFQLFQQQRFQLVVQIVTVVHDFDFHIEKPSDFFKVFPFKKDDTNSFSKTDNIASEFLRKKLSKSAIRSHRLRMSILGGGIIQPPVTVLNQKDAARSLFLKRN